MLASGSQLSIKNAWLLSDLQETWALSSRVLKWWGGSGAGNAKSQPSGPIPTPQSQVVRQPIAQGQGASTGAKELTRPAQGASEALFNFNFDINMQGLNAKQRKRLKCKLRKQKGKSVVVDKSPEVGTSGAQPELSTGGTEGPLPNPAGKLPPIPEGSERTPAPTSSIQTDLDASLHASE
nr:hypothetical protein Iba_chr12dCG13540 [Ipomoea batatas]